MKKLTIALIGTPNSGKSTLFNQLSGLKQRVGNWAGVTIERMEGQFVTGKYEVTLVDLPGMYCLSPFTTEGPIDEKITGDYLCTTPPDAVIYVLNTAELSRSLYVLLQIIELQIPCITVLTMQDLLKAEGKKVDSRALEASLGHTVLNDLTDTVSLREAIDRSTLEPPGPMITYAEQIESALLDLSRQPIAPDQPLTRGHLVQLLESNLPSSLIQLSLAKAVKQKQAEVFHVSGEEPAFLIAAARYQVVGQWVEAVVKETVKTTAQSTAFLDSLVLHRWLGLPLFLFIMYAIFWFAIDCGGILAPLIETLSHVLFLDGILMLGRHTPIPDWIIQFLAQGVGGGLAALLPLIPQIGAMFLVLTFLEDSGYMARAAFILDRLMQSLGLPGKAFVPLILGFGCNVPAILGTRILDTRRERITTMLMIPFVSCSGRLAIFTLFAAFFFPAHSALLIFSLYFVGIIAALFTAFLLKTTLLQGESTPFLMTVPHYQFPNLGQLFTHTWMRLKEFTWNAGRVTLLVSVLINGCNHISYDKGNLFLAKDPATSLLSRFAKPFTRLFSPIGIQKDNWPATVGILTGAVAKEVVIGTLSTLYLAGASAPGAPTVDAPLVRLKEALVESRARARSALGLRLSLEDEQKGASGSRLEPQGGSREQLITQFGSGLAVYSYLLFLLLYVPCASTMAVIGREAGQGWMWLSLFWGFDFAYSSAALVYQLGTLSYGAKERVATIAVILSVNASLWLLLKRYSRAPEHHAAY